MFRLFTIKHRKRGAERRSRCYGYRGKGNLSLLRTNTDGCGFEWVLVLVKHDRVKDVMSLVTEVWQLSAGFFPPETSWQCTSCKWNTALIQLMQVWVREHKVIDDQSLTPHNTNKTLLFKTSTDQKPSLSNVFYDEHKGYRRWIKLQLCLHVGLDEM